MLVDFDVVVSVSGSMAVVVATCGRLSMHFTGFESCVGSGDLSLSLSRSLLPGGAVSQSPARYRLNIVVIWLAGAEGVLIAGTC